MSLSTDRVERVTAALRAGERFVVHEEAVCFAAIAAEAVDATAILGFSRFARGVIAVAMSAERIDSLGLPLMERSPGSRRLAYTVSVDATVGTTTGISAADRAATVAALLAREPDGRLATPGHVLPIRAAEGGILERNGVAEAVVELARLSGREPVVAICEILDEGGNAVHPVDLDAHPYFGTLPSITPAAVRSHIRADRRSLSSDVADRRCSPFPRQAGGEAEFRRGGSASSGASHDLSRQLERSSHQVPGTPLDGTGNGV